jgi:hypothetical protein
VLWFLASAACSPGAEGSDQLLGFRFGHNTGQTVEFYRLITSNVRSVVGEKVAVCRDFLVENIEPRRVCRRLQLLRGWSDGTRKTAKTYSPEVRARAVRMVTEHQGEHGSQWAAICSIAAKIGCSGETLRGWVRQAERDPGLRGGHDQ